MSAKKNPNKTVSAPRRSPPVEREGSGPEPVCQEPSERSLDPADWERTRALAHAALDEALDFLRSVRDRPVWRPVPPSVRDALREPLPAGPQELEETYRQFQERILPYATGNIHPRFFGWVHGSGTVAGVLSELLAATMNSNCGGRDHGALYVERCVVDWCKELFGYPATASGLVVSGTSMGTLVGLTVARNASAGWDVRTEGLAAGQKQLVAYLSVEGHESIVKAIELLGLGRNAIRRIPVDGKFRMDLAELRRAIAADRAAGRCPLCVVGTAGTVNTAAIDDLAGLAKIAREEKLWFHADGAFGALCALSDELRPRLHGIELADSIAFDFHKWMHVPYDAGCVLVRDGEQHWRTFTTRPSYLQGAERGLAGGGRWFCEYGPELSRGFRALKVWFTLKTYGRRALGKAVLQNCRQAEYLARLVRRTPELELVAEPTLNIVCFRFRRAGLSDEALDKLNEDIVADVQEQGIAAPSTTRVNGHLEVRVNITNHRSRREDFELLVRAIVEAGNRRAPAKGGARPSPKRRVKVPV
jgi:glutamate/tyrosine decarboxylase-like PLP-dependent enzyme